MNDHPTRQQSAAVVWRRTFDDGTFEHMRLSRTDGGWEFWGHLVGVEQGRPLQVDYRIDSSREWFTTSCVIEQDFGHEHRRLVLTCDSGTWRIDGMPAPSLAGCTDVDLGVSPSTNTLPINRLRLPVGGSGEIRAAWVKFPALEVIPAAQGYDRLSENRYLYRNLGSDFRAELEIDSFGLVIDYEKIWKRIAVSQSEMK